MVEIDLYYRETAGSSFPMYGEAANVLFNGLLTGVSASGHAQTGRMGADVACAAISALLSAFSGAVAANKSIASLLTSKGRGQLTLTVSRVPPASEAWLAGLQSGLVYGLSQVQKEFPKALRVSLHRNLTLQ